MRSGALTLLILLTWQIASGQNGFGGPQASLSPTLTEERIVPDGVLDEPIWQEAEVMTSFWQQFPVDSVKAEGQTEVRMVYNNDFLYVAITSRTSDDNFVVSSLRRDYQFPGSDNITILFDTYNDVTNAFVFGMNAYGVRREALVANGGRGFQISSHPGITNGSEMPADTKTTGLRSLPSPLKP